MPRKSTKKAERCEHAEQCCYKVSAVITVDARGQTVLPKDVRKALGIGPGDKMAVIMHDAGNGPCCLSLVRASDLSKMVSGPLGELLREGD